MRKDFSQLIAHASKGRRYCFVVMAYQQDFNVFEKIQGIVNTETGLECIRADDVSAAGEHLLEKIQAVIDSAVFVIGEISSESPNIYYELGYAMGRNKPIVLLAHEGVQVPVDFRGLEVIPYSLRTRQDASVFEEALRREIAPYGDSSVALLRAMVMPHHHSPSHILVSPKPPLAPTEKLPPNLQERHTFGDYLGVIGLYGVFALLWGEHYTPELLTATRVPDSVVEADGNLYLIGSPKVNPHTGRFLARMQKGPGPKWEFGPCEGENPADDPVWRLRGDWDGEGNTPCGLFSGDTADGFEDYGLILRGPHPRHANRMVMILAGARSVGTGAACLAATRTPLVRQIADRLLCKAELGEHDKTIWVLVKGTTDRDRYIDQDNVTIVDAGVY